MKKYTISFAIATLALLTGLLFVVCAASDIGSASKSKSNTTCEQIYEGGGVDIYRMTDAYAGSTRVRYIVVGHGQFEKSVSISQ